MENKKLNRAIKHISKNLAFLVHNNGSEESASTHRLALVALKEKLEAEIKSRTELSE